MKQGKTSKDLIQNSSQCHFFKFFYYSAP